MNYEAAIAEVQQIIGWRSDKAAEIGAALRYSQSQREQPGRTYPWFLRAFSGITTVPGTVLYPVPVDYIQDSEERDGNIFYYLGTVNLSRPIFLKKRSLVDLQSKYLGKWPSDSSDPVSDVLPNGKPEEFVLQSSQILIYPIPDAAYTLYWYYWGKAATLSAGVENAWLLNAPWCLIGDAAWKLARDLGFQEGMVTAAAVRDKADADLFRAIIHRDEAGRKRSMGSRL